MTIFNFYVYDRQGKCLQYSEWHRKKAPPNLAEEQKLMFGLVFMLKQFSQKLSPKQPYDGILSFRCFTRVRCDGFQSFSTSSYKLHHIETPSGYRFLITSDVSTGDLREVLKKIYAELFVDLVLKNPGYSLGSDFKSDAFAAAVDKFIRSQAFFS